MTDVQLPSSGNFTVWIALPNAFANWKRPTAAELNASHNATDSISWNDYSFGTQASTQVSDKSVNDKGNRQVRGFSQFGGSMSFYYPKRYNDPSNTYSNTFDVLYDPWTVLYIVLRYDGEKTSELAANGDFVSVYKVMSDGWSDIVVGEEDFKYTITFQPQGQIHTYGVVGTGAGAVVITPAGPQAITVAGGPVTATATLDGRPYTRGVQWASTNPAVATVSQNGVVTPVTPGTATISATDTASGGAVTSVYTVTAGP